MAVEYLGVFLVIAAIVAALLELDVTDQLHGGVEEEVERATDDPDAVTGDLISTGFGPGPIDLPGGPVQLSTVGGITVHSSIAGQLGAMLAAAAADGVHLSGGGYRSSESQIALRRAHCGTSYYAIYQMPSSQCTPPTAPPGRSMHERGLAVDFNNCSSRSTACFQWLAANAARFGFYNFPVEPWHWSIDGT